MSDYSCGLRTVALVRRRLLLFVLALTASGLFAGAVATTRSERTPPDATRYVDRIRECAGPPRSDLFADRNVMAECVSTVVEQLAAELGPSKARAVMFALMELEPRFSDCHVPSHAIAHGAARVLSLRKLMLESFNECTYGYLDGATMALGELHAAKTDGELADMVWEFCQYYPAEREDRAEVLSNCFHGFGHVLSLRHAADTTRALAGCELLPGVPFSEGQLNAPAQCAGGVTMSFADAVANGAPTTPRYQYASMLCATLPDKGMKISCLTFTGNEDIRSRGEDLEGFLSWCVGSPGLRDVKDLCWQTVGTFVGRTQRFESAGAICFAESPASTEDRNRCLAAMVHSMRETTASSREEAVSRICGEFADNDRCSALKEAIAGSP